MSIKKYLPLAGVIILVIALCAAIYLRSSVEEDATEIELSVAEVDNAYDEIGTVYTSEFQESVYEQVSELKEQQSYSLESPLVIENPYQTLNTALYMYFITEEASKIEYTVSTDGYEDFTQTVYQTDGDNLATEHEFSLIGLVPSETNKIVLREINEDGEVINKISFEYEAGELYNTDMTIQGDVTKGDSTVEVSDGLYAVFNALGIENKSIPLYDNNGTLRVEIVMDEFRGDRILSTEDGIYFANAEDQVSLMDATGHLTEFINLEGFEMHHDIIWGQNNDMIILASETDNELAEDRILSVDMETGEITEIINLEDLFSDYLSQLEEQDDVDLTDWMHINSIDFIGDNRIVISSRETSTLIAIDDIYNNPTIYYMIGSDNYWSGTGYEDYVYTAEGDFALFTGQHSITYLEDDSLEDGQYYLYMFNNNYVVCDTRPDYDWDADEHYEGVTDDKENSYFYKILVDENEKTFSLVESIAVDRSPYVSDAQIYDGNRILCSGYNFLIYEFDPEGEMIQNLQLTGYKLFYRSFKYSFEGFWFE